MVACFFNKPRILAALIRAGAEVVVRNNEGLKTKTKSNTEHFFIAFRQRCI
jgi:hypothetical protein